MNTFSIRRYVLLICSGLLLLGACTETDNSLKWPEVTKESKPWTRWWWQGSAFSEADITAALEQYKEAGIGGVEITPIYGVRGYEDQFVEFLSPRWMKLLEHTLKEAKRLDMGVDLANASGWPFGGPWVSRDIACKNIVSQVYNLKGGESLNDPIKYIQLSLVRTVGKSIDIKDLKKPITANSNLQEHAFDQVRYEEELPIIVVTANSGKGEVVDLTDNVTPNGKLNWVAPEGDWRIIALFQGYHGKMVERAGPGGEGDVIDHFSQEAIDAYLKKFDEAFKGYDVSYLRYYFNDSYEVDDAQGESNWTPKFFEEFKNMRGYDLKEYLPALLGMDTPERNSRVRYDYRLTINDLLLERYSKPWQAWAAKQGKGIRNQAHGSPANILDLYAVSDVPEIEGRDILSVKSAPSAMHVMGKKYSSSESATWLGEHFQSTLGDVKGAMDLFLLGGVNHTFYHGTAFSRQDVPWPGWLFYAAVHFTPTNSFWTDFGAFNQYITRSQSFLQAGKPDNDILLYYTIADVWSRPDRAMLQHFHGLDRTFEGTPVRADARAMQDKGYAWDLISDRQLEGVTVSKGKLKTSGGTEYGTLFLSACDVIPYETFTAILDLAKKGATILVHNSMPKDIAGFTDYEEIRGKFNDLVSGLSFGQEGNLKVAKHGKGKIVLADDIDALLSSANIRREAMYDSGLECIRRQSGNGSTYYFIVNSGSDRFDGFVPVSSQLKSAAIFDPMTGKAGYARTQDNSVYTQLNPGESVIIETFGNNRQGEMFAYYNEAGPEQPLAVTWDVTFTKGGPELPASRNGIEPGSWIDYEGNEYKIFSGTADYTTVIPAMAGTADALRINLGDVRESAAIYLNGEYITTLFAKPFSVDISKDLLKGNDQLTVKVSNSMANRIIDLDKRGVQWKIFYNTNFPARIRQNSDNGVFTAARWEPRASGLIGPVTVTPLSL